MPDLSFIFAQSLSGLTAAMFLFLIASGLSLIFGVLRVLNFAHGSFYMLGALWRVPVRAVARDRGRGGSGGRCSAPRSASPSSAGWSSGFLLRHLYAKEELYQLLFTYALVLILSDVAKIIWGTQQKSVSRPPGLDGAFDALRHDDPLLQPVHPDPRPRASRSPSGSCCTARARAASCAPPRSTARRWARSASTSTGSTPASSCSALSSAGSAARSSRRCATIVPGMDTEIIVEAFIVVVIGGLGSFWGTFLGALIYGQVLSFGILFFPRFSIFAVFALMAAVLIIRPWGLLGRPLEMTARAVCARMRRPALLGTL